MGKRIINRPLCLQLRSNYVNGWTVKLFVSTKSSQRSRTVLFPIKIVFIFVSFIQVNKTPLEIIRLIKERS